MAKRLTKQTAKQYICYAAADLLEASIQNGSEWIYEIFGDTTAEEGKLLEGCVTELADELGRRGHAWNKEQK